MRTTILRVDQTTIEVDEGTLTKYVLDVCRLYTRPGGIDLTVEVLDSLCSGVFSVRARKWLAEHNMLVLGDRAPRLDAQAIIRAMFPGNGSGTERFPPHPRNPLPEDSPLYEIIKTIMEKTLQVSH